jgi:putative membrane protein
MVKRRLGDYGMLILKGMGMGAADVVPGVSGGTIAFITGIYEELVHSIKNINFATISKLWKEGLPAFWKALNGNFLVSVIAGILASVLTLARLLEYLLVNHPVLIWSFFFGLIIGSAIFIARSIGKWNAGIVLGLLAGIAVAWVITSVTPAETTEAYWFVFISGAVAICAMILPGISGSFILLLLGKYQYILNALNEGKISVISTLLVGALVGIISFSHLLSWLLRRFHHLTIAVLSGFMIGSLNKIWPWKITIEEYLDSHGLAQPLVQKNVLPGRFAETSGADPQVIWAALLALAGFLLIFVFEGISSRGKGGFQAGGQQDKPAGDPNGAVAEDPAEDTAKGPVQG